MEGESNKVLEWKGFNYLFLDGKLLLGPSGFKPLLITGLFILIPFILFLNFNSQFYEYNLSIAISVIAVLILIVTIYYMVLTAMKDPGILARSAKNLTSEQTKFKTKVNQMGYLTIYKRCQTCFIIRPLRSHHCADCDNCVERFDHHCPWLSNCVAKRNYRDFYMFVLLLNILTTYMLAFSVAHIAIFLKVNIYLFEAIAHFENSSAAALNEVIVSLFIVIYGLISMIFTTGLFVYHTNLIVKNNTTNEELKSYYKKPIGNPHSRSIRNNCHQALFSITSDPSFMGEVRSKKLAKEERKKLYLDEEQKRLNKNEEMHKENIRHIDENQEINVEVLDENNQDHKKDKVENSYRAVQSNRKESNVYIDRAESKHFSMKAKEKHQKQDCIPELDDEKITNHINNFKSEEESVSIEKDIKAEFDSNNKTFPLPAKNDNQNKFKFIKLLRKSPVKDDITKNNSNEIQDDNAVQIENSKE